MTEEEIREKAREFNANYEYQTDWEDYPIVSRADVEQGFIAGAKSRNKEIEELKKKIKELKKKIKELNIML